MQEQMMKQSQYLQDALADKQLKQSDLNRKRVANSEETSHIKTFNDQNQSNDDIQEHSNGKPKDSGSPTDQHPYLGKSIDFKG